MEQKLLLTNNADDSLSYSSSPSSEPSRMSNTKYSNKQGFQVVCACLSDSPVLPGEPLGKFPSSANIPVFE